jgi:hypothetical protein
MLGTDRQPLEDLIAEAATEYNASQACRTAVHSVDQVCEMYWFVLSQPDSLATCSCKPCLVGWAGRFETGSGGCCMGNAGSSYFS